MALAAIALAVGASLAPASTLLARAAPNGPGGSSGPANPPGASEAPGSTGPAQPTPCTTRSLHLHCPDIIMSAPYNLHLDRTTVPGRVLLRAASSVNNRGSGPLEIRAHLAGGHSAAVYQAIRDSSGRPHLFRTAARLVFKYVPGERYEHESVGNFSYWKFEHVAAFQLWSLDAHLRALKLVRTGPKVDYCLRDLVRSAPSARSPGAPVYPACNQDPYIRSDVLGTSVGWSDVYPYEYPEQWIDVTGLRGHFAYVQIADPNNLLLESNHSNDLSETYVTLPSGRVLGHRVGVAAP